MSCCTPPHPLGPYLPFCCERGLPAHCRLPDLAQRQNAQGALLSGKICTTILFVSLIILVLLPDLSTKIVYAITTIDCVAMLVSFIGYARIYYTQSPMIQQLPEE